MGWLMPQELVLQSSTTATWSIKERKPQQRQRFMKELPIEMIRSWAQRRLVQPTPAFGV